MSVLDYELLTLPLPGYTDFVRDKLHLVMFGVGEGQFMDILLIA